MQAEVQALRRRRNKLGKKRSASRSRQIEAEYGQACHDLQVATERLNKMLKQQVHELLTAGTLRPTTASAWLTLLERRRYVSYQTDLYNGRRAFHVRCIEQLHQENNKLSEIISSCE